MVTSKPQEFGFLNAVTTSRDCFGRVVTNPRGIPNRKQQDRLRLELELLDRGKEHLPSEHKKAISEILQGSFLLSTQKAAAAAEAFCDKPDEERSDLCGQLLLKLHDYHTSIRISAIAASGAWRLDAEQTFEEAHKELKKRISDTWAKAEEESRFAALENAFVELDHHFSTIIKRSTDRYRLSLAVMVVLSAATIFLALALLFLSYTSASFQLDFLGETMSVSPEYGFFSAKPGNTAELVYSIGLRVIVFAVFIGLTAFFSRMARVHANRREHSEHRQTMVSAMRYLLHGTFTDQQRDAVLVRIIDEIAEFGSTGLVNTKEDGGGDLDSQPAFRQLVDIMRR
jgi:hypothetical protein